MLSSLIVQRTDVKNVTKIKKTLQIILKHFKTLNKNIGHNLFSMFVSTFIAPTKQHVTIQKHTNLQT